MSLQVSILVTIGDETGSTLISVGRSESVLPVSDEAPMLAQMAGERGSRLIREVEAEVGRQIVHLGSLLGEDGA